MGRRRKNRTHVKPDEEAVRKIPKALVFRRGDIGGSLMQLLQDMREVMLPFTAPNLKERKNNTLKDFLNVAGTLSVSHFLMFSSTTVGSYLRVARVPQGPTLTFRILQYSTATDVRSLQPNPHSPGEEFASAAILVLNGFGQKQEHHLELTRLTLRQMFPSIPVQDINLDSVRRVVLFNYDQTTDTLEFRHYYIKTSLVGVNKSVKQVVQDKVRDLSQYQDISDYILGDLGRTESDNEADTPVVEDTRAPKVKPKAKKSKKKKADSTPAQKSVKLVEMGPRMQLQLIKIEEELCSGTVPYHKFVKKTQADIAEQTKRKTEEKKRKEALKKKLHFQNTAIKRREARRGGNKGEENDGGDADGEDEGSFEEDVENQRKRKRETSEDEPQQKRRKIPVEVVGEKY